MARHPRPSSAVHQAGTSRLRDAPAATPPVADSRQRAKLFANGRSQAVRLPREFRLPGTEVAIHREGDRIILEPLTRDDVDAKGWPRGLWARIDALGAGDGFPDPGPLPARFIDGVDLGDPS